MTGLATSPSVTCRLGNHDLFPRHHPAILFCLKPLCFSFAFISVLFISSLCLCFFSPSNGQRGGELSSLRFPCPGRPTQQAMSSVAASSGQGSPMMAGPTRTRGDTGAEEISGAKKLVCENFIQGTLRFLVYHFFMFRLRRVSRPSTPKKPFLPPATNVLKGRCNERCNAPFIRPSHPFPQNAGQNFFSLLDPQTPFRKTISIFYPPPSSGLPVIKLHRPLMMCLWFDARHALGSPQMGGKGGGGYAQAPMLWGDGL